MPNSKKQSKEKEAIIKSVKTLVGFTVSMSEERVMARVQQKTLLVMSPADKIDSFEASMHSAEKQVQIAESEPKEQ